MKLTTLVVLLLACGPRWSIEEVPEAGEPCACGHQIYGEDGGIELVCLPMPDCRWVDWPR